MQHDPLPAVNSQGDPAPEAKSFLLSKTFWILLLGLLIAPVLKKAGIEFTDAAQQQTAELILQVMTAVGALWARGKAQGPLTFHVGPGAVMLAFVAVLLLTGCAGFQIPKARIVYHSQFGDLSYDGKTLKTDLHGELAPGLSVEGVK